MMYQDPHCRSVSVANEWSSETSGFNNFKGEAPSKSHFIVTVLFLECSASRTVCVFLLIYMKWSIVHDDNISTMKPYLCLLLLKILMELQLPVVTFLMCVAWEVYLKKRGHQDRCRTTC